MGANKKNSPSEKKQRILKMNELFGKKEINPTVKVVITMNQDEKTTFKQFAEKMNIPLSALVRLAVKSFIKGEGAKYGEN